MPSESFDELLKRDALREKDGFEKRIKIRRILAGPGKIIAIPYVVEEKLIHGDFEPTGEHGQDEAGRGEGEFGSVVAEIPIWGDEGEGDIDSESDSNAGDGEGSHGIETEAYQLGKELSEKLKLPNLKDKVKKVPTDEYIYDLTDRHKGSGQLLDKKETLKSIIKSNKILDRLDENNPDMTNLVVGPQDKVYRVLSRERIWKSQAVVFFLRDYSGSMIGYPTRAIISQHLMLYSWLLFQYEKLVIPRFIVHDTVAKEVSVDNYFKVASGGGTLIPSAYKLINQIVEEENLPRDYNIYVFQGTDGDDSDEGELAVPEIEIILSYVNLMGVSLLGTPYNEGRETEFEKYIKIGRFIERNNIFRMHKMSYRNPSDKENEEAIKALVTSG